MLNWLARYAPLRDTLLDGGGRPRTSILDVGCGCHGLACAFPEVPFAGTDVLFPFALAPTMVGVRSAPGPLPFADGAFGTVLCLDVLEHIPPADRTPFVAELARVAAERVIVACPSSEAQFVDDFLRDVLRPTPVWLAEHDDCGLPTPAAIARLRERGRGLRRARAAEPATACWRCSSRWPTRCRSSPAWPPRSTAGTATSGTRCWAPPPSASRPARRG